MYIFSKKIPEILIKTISSNWKNKIDLSLWQKIFPDKIREPILYSLSTIKIETSSIRDDFHRQVISKKADLNKNDSLCIGDDIFWFGRNEKGITPGEINGLDIVLIGEIGLEMMFGLYYQNAISEPSVIYFDSRLLWIEIAPNIKSFIKKTNLT